MLAKLKDFFPINFPPNSKISLLNSRFRKFCCACCRKNRWKKPELFVIHTYVLNRVFHWTCVKTNICTSVTSVSSPRYYHETFRSQLHKDRSTNQEHTVLHFVSHNLFLCTWIVWGIFSRENLLQCFKATTYSRRHANIDHLSFRIKNIRVRRRYLDINIYTLFPVCTSSSDGPKLPSKSYNSSRKTRTHNHLVFWLLCTQLPVHKRVLSTAK